MKISRIYTAIYNLDCKKKSLQLYTCSSNPENQIVIGASCYTGLGLIPLMFVTRLEVACRMYPWTSTYAGFAVV